MNTPFKGKIAWLPDFIGEELMNQQELQGNKRDISVFEKFIIADDNRGGFEWEKTIQSRIFWDRVLLGKDINLFLAWFRPELEVFDYDDNQKHLTQVIGYNENEMYPFFLTTGTTSGFTFKHARLPKKENTEKLELLKKADELLTKAAELKSAAEKL